jgi:hypothetical protein
MTLVSGMSPLLAPKDRRPSSHYFRSTGALGFDSSSRLKTATTRNAEIIPGFRYSKLMFTIFLPSGDVQKVSHAGYSSNSSKEVDVLRIRGIACILPTHHDIVREKAFAHDSLPSTISSSVVFHNQRSLRYCVTAKTSPSTYKNFKIKPLTPFQVSAKGDIEILVLAEKTMIPGRKEPCMPGQLLTSEDGAFSCSNDSRYSTNQSTYETENILN